VNSPRILIPSNEARACYDRAVHWLQGQKALGQQNSRELMDFRAETEAVLAAQPGDLPAEVFAPE
jgi:hypothetical protein